jgi:mono/diheme cytochrome c family protein
MRRPLLILVLALGAVGAFTGGLAWLLTDPTPPPGASRAERLYVRFCAECHGTDGRGSWRAALFLIRPGDLTDPARLAGTPDRYLFDVIKHGGAPIGRPGMPAFGAQLDDTDIELLAAYVRALPGRRAPPPR